MQFVWHTGNSQRVKFVKGEYHKNSQKYNFSVYISSSVEDQDMKLHIQRGELPGILFHCTGFSAVKYEY